MFRSFSLLKLGVVQFFFDHAVVISVSFSFCLFNLT